MILRKLFVLPLLCLLAFTSSQKKIKIYLIGDSTMAKKAQNKLPEAGWGVPFERFFNQNAEVDNRAQNGRSTKSFIEEGRWTAVLDYLKAGDYVLIQFGHNDESPKKVASTTPVQFQDNLRRYVNETRAKRANPILITPVARRKFDENGKVVDTHKEYAQLVRNVAKELEVPLIDLSQESMDLLQSFGEEQSKQLYLHLDENQHPNYPQGVKDNTHFNELGAKYMAEMVCRELRKINSPLADYMVNNAQNPVSVTLQPTNSNIPGNSSAAIVGDVTAANQGGTLEAYQYSASVAAVNDAQGWQRLRYTEAVPNLPFNNTYDAGAYLQYQTSPATSKYLNITSFGISVLGGSTGYARLMVKYAISTTTPKDGDFHDMPTTGGYFLENGKAKTYAATATDPVFLINAGKTANTEAKRRLTFSGMNINLEPGQTFYIRLYPYLADLTAPVSVRYIMVRNAVISGQTGKEPFHGN